MAKIKFYKLKGNQNNGKPIESIDLCDDDSIKERLQTKSKLSKEQCATRIKSRDVVLLENSDENEQSFGM